MSSSTLNTQQTSHTLHGAISEEFWNWLRDNAWVLEPSEPQHIAAPVPSRARASYADILDNEWELWRGGVRLSSTKQEAVQRECPDEDSPYATWPPPSSLLRGPDASHAGDGTSSQESGIGLGLVGVGAPQSSVIEHDAYCGIESLQCSCEACLEAKWLQDEAEKAEVERLLNVLLHVQQQRRRQLLETKRLIARLLLVQAVERQARSETEGGMSHGRAGMMEEDPWHWAGDVRYGSDESPANSSTRPLSLATSASTDSMSQSAGYAATPSAFSHKECKGRAHSGTYDAAPGLSYADSSSSFTNHSMPSLPSTQTKGLSIFETIPRTSAGKASWGNRVGRRIRAYGHQIMGRT